MRTVPSLLAATLCFASCHGNNEPPQKSPPEVRPPTRGAVGDQNLRVLMAEVASAKACEMIKGNFRGLRAPEDQNKITGVLWMRECNIENDGTNVTFKLGGTGWQWADQTKKKAGGTFELKDYVKFDVNAVMHGSLDVAYDDHDHVTSLWFSPSKAPDVKFTPTADVDVDEKGTWSNVVGGVSTLFGSSPDSQGKHEAKKQGTDQFEQQLGEGMTVAIDMCTGYQRFSMGRPDKGQLGPPNPGESRDVPVEIEPKGMLMFGPFFAQDGMHVKVETDGPIRVGLACAKDVEAAADAFAHDRPLPEIKTMTNKDIVAGSGALAVKPQRCKVAFVVKSLSEKKVRFGWNRPPTEIAQSTGGPAIHCDRKTTLSSAGPHAVGSGAAPAAAARRR